MGVSRKTAPRNPTRVQHSSPYYVQTWHHVLRKPSAAINNINELREPRVVYCSSRVWGIAQPFAGAAADRYGAAPVVAFGSAVFALGLGVAALAPTGLMLVVGMGFLVGVGISCASLGVVLAAGG